MAVTGALAATYGNFSTGTWWRILLSFSPSRQD